MSDYIIINGELYHHGVKGQKWGVRRFQNKDGSLTPEGKFHYSTKDFLTKTNDGYVLKKGTMVQRISYDTEKKTKRLYIC